MFERYSVDNYDLKSEKLRDYCDKYNQNSSFSIDAEEKANGIHKKKHLKNEDSEVFIIVYIERLPNNGDRHILIVLSIDDRGLFIACIILYILFDIIVQLSNRNDFVVIRVGLAF